MINSIFSEGVLFVAVFHMDKLFYYSMADGIPVTSLSVTIRFQFSLILIVRIMYLKIKLWCTVELWFKVSRSKGFPHSVFIFWGPGKSPI
jgi:hypothetical protein